MAVMQHAQEKRGEIFAEKATTEPPAFHLIAPSGIYNVGQMLAPAAGVPPVSNSHRAGGGRQTAAVPGSFMRLLSMILSPVAAAIGRHTDYQIAEGFLP